MDKQDRVMLDRWAGTLRERNAILLFWNHLEQCGHECTRDVNIEKELDRYHGINQAQLERERRQIHEACMPEEPGE